MNAQATDTNTKAVSFTCEPEEALCALRGVSCILDTLAESGAGISNHKDGSNALWLLGQVTGAAAEKLSQSVYPAE